MDAKPAAASAEEVPANKDGDVVMKEIKKEEKPVFKEPEHLIINKKMSDNKDPNIKWEGLEHRGVTFYPRYEPHRKPLLFKGEPIEINPEIEEACNHWVQVEGSDFAEKQLVRDNFESSFLAMFPESLGAESLKEFDFSKIKEQVEKAKEARNARTAEEKKVEKDA